MIRPIRIDSSLASFHLRIIAAITSCIPLNILLFNNKGISFLIKALLYFIKLNESVLPKILNTTGTSSTNFSDTLVIVPNWSAKRSVPVPEEHNIALKFKEDLLNNDHFNLLKRYKANLSLLSSPFIPENHCSKKLLQIKTKDDKILGDLITTLKTGRPLEIHELYNKNCEKNLHTRYDLLFLDNKIVKPAAPEAHSVRCYTSPIQASLA